MSISSIKGEFYIASYYYKPTFYIPPSFEAARGQAVFYSSLYIFCFGVVVFIIFLVWALWKNGNQ